MLLLAVLVWMISGVSTPGTVTGPVTPCCEHSLAVQPKACRGSIRPHGADEFALLVRVKSLEDRRRVAAQIHTSVTDVPTQMKRPVTRSMGPLMISPNALYNEPMLTQAADRFMFVVKEAGKPIQIEETQAYAFENT